MDPTKLLLTTFKMHFAFQKAEDRTEPIRGLDPICWDEESKTPRRYRIGPKQYSMETCVDSGVSYDIIFQLQSRKTETGITFAKWLADEKRYVIIGVKFGRGSMLNGIYSKHGVKPLVLGVRAITFQAPLWGMGKLKVVENDASMLFELK